MTHLLELPDMRRGYIELCEYVMMAGKSSKPRDLETRELENVTFTIGDLVNTLPLGCNRGVNPTIAALEALQIIGGVSAPDLLVAAAPAFKQFQEPDNTFWGAYGRRAGRHQFDSVIDKLNKDADSRQAIITMWDPRLDNEPGHKDYPCTIALGLRLRNDRLNMSVVMRSNDVWWGVAYDVFQFTQLQWTLANVLAVEPGTYTHTAWSLHVYERDYEKIDALRLQESPSMEMPTGLLSPWRAELILEEHGSITLPTDSEAWYIRQADAARALRAR